MPRRKPAPCPQADLHAPDQPTGYRAWHAWAEEMSKIHRQKRCPGCGLYKIWTPKETADAR